MRLSVLIPAVTALALAGCNEPPGDPVVSISPEAPTTVDALTVTFVEEAADPNKSDEVIYTYEWTVDGQPSDVTGAEVPAELTRAGQFWSVKVTAADDKLTGGSAEASVAIMNTPPSVTATIEPSQPLSTDDLTLVIVGEDIDGDTVNTTVSWTRDGEAVGISSDRVPADRTQPGEVWEATIVPKDAKDEGEPFTVDVQIQNQKPEMTRIILRPTLAYEGSVLEAVPSSTDPDGDDVTYSYNWIVNGSKLGAGTSAELDGTSFDRGDTVAVEIVANDGQADSAPMTSETVSILNTPPSITGVAVDPAEAFEDSTLTCAPEGWSDDDGDAEQYQYSWTVNGDVVSTAASIDGSVFDKDDRVVCTVTPFDGTEVGRTVATRPLTISNSKPVLSSVSISPSSPKSGTTVSVTVGSVTDADGDEVTYDIDWYVDGRVVAKGESLLPGSFVKGEDIYALVTPDDGDEEGTAVKSNVVTAINSGPRIVSFGMTPTPAFSADNLGLSLETDDWDGDTVTVKYNWTINGTRYGNDATTTVPSSETRRGDEVKLVVTTSDGTEAGDTRTATQKIKLKIDAPTIAIDPTDPETSDDLFCEILKGSTDADGGTITYHFSWTKDGSAYTGTTSTTDYTGDTIPSSATKDREVYKCSVYALSPNAASDPATSTVTVADRDGQVRNVSGTWLNVRYEQCGTGTTGCNASAAEKACSDIGMKVVSHASNGTTKVHSLGATNSCNFSASYFTTDTTRATGDCLVGISNLQWSSCCGTSSWHGRTMKFASAKTIFGYVASSNSGYVSGYPSTGGATWGCQTTGSAARTTSGCTKMFVACTK